MYIIEFMPSARTETSVGRRRRHEAQITKAWKVVKFLREDMNPQSDPDILLWLQLCDDRDWATIAEAVKLKPTERLGRPIAKGGTSCVVSRDVKAVIYGLLRSTGSHRPVKRGEDALTRRRIPE